MKYVLFLVILAFFVNLIYSDAVTFFDIQDANHTTGDAIMIQSIDTNGNKIYAMIDTGSDKKVSYNRVIKYLNNNKVSTLEWILISHNHGDHINGFSGIIDHYNKTLSVKNVYIKEYKAYDTYYSSSTSFKSLDEYLDKQKENYNNFIKKAESIKANINYITKESNNTLELGNYQFKLLNVEEIFTEEVRQACIDTKQCNENSNSVIAVGKNNDRYYYFNGDIDTYPNEFLTYNDSKVQDIAKKNTLEKWIRNGLNIYGIDHFDVYKASHHGLLHNNSQKSFIEARPSICVVSGTEKGKISATQLVSRVKAGNSTAETYFTGSGYVIINQNGNDIEVIQGADVHKEVDKSEIDHETTIKWFYNIEKKKCLTAPTINGKNLTFGNCNNNRSLWVMPKDHKGCIPTVYNTTMCMTFDNSGKFVMEDCNTCKSKNNGIIYKNNAITSIANSKKCLGTNNKNAIVMNNCNSKNKGQKWSLWNISPSEQQEKWIHIKNTKKCLYAPNGNTAPIIKDCDDSDASKWIVTSKYRNYLRSLAYPDRCVHVDDIENGTLSMNECDSNAYFESIDNSYTKEALKAFLNKNKCIDVKKSSKKNELNLYPCNRNKDNQHWVFSDNNPNYKQY
ncbi:hypothetical protein PIROE2DRAFT_12232 [Piromyces sp. E2]|nr:hypothetical protein PIROE2DRAFT_12232 [Piromyces sp. E2]|eukprot:OUM61689.1 hypothetical protein PIROE2DRAFT_12232 [Piromyces sp. E2]